MNGFGDELAKQMGRAIGCGIVVLVFIVIAAFLIGRYSA